MSEIQNGDAPNGTNKSSVPSKRHEEYQYLDLVREILDDGEHRPDRCESPLDRPPLVTGFPCIDCLHYELQNRNGNTVALCP